MAIEYNSGNLVIDPTAIGPGAAMLVDLSVMMPGKRVMYLGEIELFSGNTGSFALYNGDPGQGAPPIFAGEFTAVQSRVPWSGQKEIPLSEGEDLWALAPGAMTIEGTISIRAVS